MRLPLILLAVLATGCAGATERDSDLPPEWGLSAEPELVIGEDGTREGELDRVIAVLPLPNEEIAVVDAGHRAIRVFSATGDYRRTLGRQGTGPGEFELMAWAQVDHDTLVIFDVGSRRATLMGGDGTVFRTITLRPEGGPGFVFPATRSASGHWVTTANLGTARMIEQGGAPPTGVYRDTVGIGLLPPGGAGMVEDLLELPTQLLVTVAEHGLVMPSQFSVGPQVVRLGSRIGVADGESGTIHWFGADGGAAGSATIAIPRAPLAAAEVRRLRDVAVGKARTPRGQAMAEASHSPDAAPAHLPLFSAVLPDGDQLLWLEEWQYEAEARVRYRVVDTDGAWRATVTMSPGFKVMTIGPDWVLGIHRDEDGVQRVMRYGLERR